MEAGPAYKTFSCNKTVEELLYYSSLWITEFSFVKIELAFINRLIKAYPFTATTPNLYERLQLFILELDNFDKAKENILVKINDYDKKLRESQETESLAFDHFHMAEFEKLAEEVFMYLKHYKKLKIRIFEYINGLMN